MRFFSVLAVAAVVKGQDPKSALTTAGEAAAKAAEALKKAGLSDAIQKSVTAALKGGAGLTIFDFATMKPFVEKVANIACGTDAAKTCAAIGSEEAVCTTIKLEGTGGTLEIKDKCLPKTLCKNLSYNDGKVTMTCGSAKLMYAAAAAAIATASMM